MVGPFHGNLTPGSIHVLANFTYANSAARTGAVGLVSGDQGKVAWQQDDNSFWVLVDDSPVTWVPLAGDAAATLAAHIADTSAAHAASAISFAPAGTLASTDAQAAIVEAAGEALAATAAHVADAANPHAVTKAQVGLGSADNTSDAGKPVSAAQAAADAVVQAAVDTHVADAAAAHAATAISAATFGTIAGTTVQAQLEEIFAEAGGGGGGHTVQDDGTPLTQRAALNIIPGASGATVTDDDGNDATVLDLSALTGGGGGGVSALVETLTAPSGGSPSFVFSTLPADGEVLRILIVGRGEDSNMTIEARLTLNGDTGANYHHQYGQSYSGNNNSAGELPNGAYFQAGSLPAATAPAGHAGIIDLILPNYRGTVFHKPLISRNGYTFATNDGAEFRATGIWRNTAAIISITITPSAGDFAEGTKAYLFREDSGGGGLPAGATGDLLYHDGTAWVVRTAGTVGQVLTMVSGAPAWV